MQVSGRGVNVENLLSAVDLMVENHSDHARRVSGGKLHRLVRLDGRDAGLVFKRSTFEEAQGVCVFRNRLGIWHCTALIRSRASSLANPIRQNIRLVKRRRHQGRGKSDAGYFAKPSVVQGHCIFPVLYWSHLTETGSGHFAKPGWGIVASRYRPHRTPPLLKCCHNTPSGDWR